MSLSAETCIEYYKSSESDATLREAVLDFKYGNFLLENHSRKLGLFLFNCVHETEIVLF